MATQGAANENKEKKSLLGRNPSKEEINKVFDLI